jgi:hypothetical protein
MVRFLGERKYLAKPELFLSALQDAYARQSLPGLRAAQADLSQRVRRLDCSEQAELQLRLDMASTPYDPAGGIDQLVEAVLSRGAIETDEEYEVVLARVEEAHGDPSRDLEVQELNRLLTAESDRGVN